jgi:hypothetical protein
MNDNYPTQVAPESNERAVALAERMDLSIGEASTVMGTMLTELMRRTLRGGVMQIGEELHGYVAEKVDATIADRTPAIEQAAAEVADKTARMAATEVAKDEVLVLDQKTAEAARDLAGKIDLAEKKAELANASTILDLSGQIRETEKRVSEAAHADAVQQLQDYQQRAREGTARMKARLKRMDGALDTVGKQILDEQSARHAEHAAVRAELEQRAADVLRRLEKETRDRRAEDDRLRTELDKLLLANETLSARVAELEKPGWFSRLLRKLAFWRKRA